MEGLINVALWVFATLVVVAVSALVRGVQKYKNIKLLEEEEII
jgi:hypothetical protein